MGFFKKFGGLLGSVIGLAFGTPLAAVIGTLIGGILSRPDKPETQTNAPAKIQTSAYGQFIPVIYGRFALAGNIIDGPENGTLQEVDDGGALDRYLTLFIAFCEGERRIDKLWHNGHVVFDRYGTGLRWQAGDMTYDPATGEEYQNLVDVAAQPYEGLWLYRGTETQMPNPWMQALHANPTPAYRGLCGIAICRHLLDYNDGQLGTWRALCVDPQLDDTEEFTTPGHVIAAHLTRGIPYEIEGLPGEALDAVGITTMPGLIRGCAQLSMAGRRDLVEKVATFSFHDVLETGGRIQVSNRQDPTIHEIEDWELGAHDDGGDAPPRDRITIGNAAKLPGKVGVKFFDQDLDYNEGFAQAPREVGGNASTETIELPIVATAPEMKRFAQIATDEQWVARTPHEVVLGPHRIDVATADVLRINEPEGGYHYVRVGDQGMGVPGAIVCQGNSWSPEPYDQPEL